MTPKVTWAAGEERSLPGVGRASRGGAGKADFNSRKRFFHSRLTQMYGRYREDLGQFARAQAKKLDELRKKEEKVGPKKGFRKFKSAWKDAITGPCPNPSHPD